jgi:D-glycero-alpha-D-manno-heptose 1-phosphate guanylyltransferase
MIQEAIILAGGFGTRLQSVVSEVPKPMAPINGHPFLEYLIRYLHKFGIQRIVFSVGYKSEIIESYFGSSFEGITIDYAKEAEPLGTGGGLKNAMEKCHSEHVLVLNGDTFLALDLDGFYNFHVSHQADVSICLRNIEEAARYGTVHIDENNRLLGFNEKSGLAVPGLINAGVYLIKRTTFMHFDLPAKFSLEKDFFEPFIRDLRIMGLVNSGYFIDIGIPKDYQQAQDDFKRFEY